MTVSLTVSPLHPVKNTVKMPLNDRQLRNAKPQAKPYKLTDGSGLYVLVQPSGGKYCRFDYRHDGKRHTLALGTYPDVPLIKARERHQQARQMLTDGIDPRSS